MNTVLKIDLLSYEHRFVRILPEQVPDTWPFIVPFIEEALVSSADGDNLPMIFNNLLSGCLEAWILVRKGDSLDWKDAETAAVVTVQVTEDRNTGSRSLLVYTVTGADYLSDELWKEMTVATSE